MPPELVLLFQRYNRLAGLLPAEDEMETALEDARARAGARVILAEMAEVKEQIDAFLLRHGRRGRAHREMETP